VAQNPNNPRVESQSGPARFDVVFSPVPEGAQLHPIVGTNTMPLDRVRHLISEKPLRRLVRDTPLNDSDGAELRD
jgi:hypothetical protein